MSPPREQSEDGSLDSRLVRVETSLQFYKEQLNKLDQNFCKFEEDVKEAIKDLREERDKLLKQRDEKIKDLTSELEDLKEAKIGIKAWVVGALAVLSVIWPFISHFITKFLGW